MKFVRFFACALLAAVAAHAADPWLRLARVTPAAEQWRADDPFIVGVTVALRDTADAPRSVTFDTKNNDFGRALSVELRGPDGRPRAAEWRGGAGGQWGPVTLESLQQRTFFFELDENARRGLALTPGRYTLHATLTVAGGTGWRGRIEAAALPVTVVTQPAPELRLSVPAGGELMAGDPLLLGVTFIAPRTWRKGDSFALPDFLSDQWKQRLQVDVRDAGGRVVNWEWSAAGTTNSPPTGSLRAGARFGPALLRVPPRATVALPPGDYTLVARLPAAGAGQAVTATGPLRIRVRAPAESVSADDRMTSLALVLADAGALRRHAQRVQSFLSWQDRLFTEAAGQVARAVPAARTLVAERPQSARAACLLAEALLAQDDRAGAEAALAPIAALPDAGEAGIAAGIKALRARLAVALNENDRYFQPHWQKALAAANATRIPVVPRTATAPVASVSAPAPVAPPASPEIGAGNVIWATSARASSEYRSTEYSAARAVGAPDVPRASDNGKAWASKLPDAGPEWIELAYAPPVAAAGVRVVQSFNPGAIVRIEVVDAEGKSVEVWTGPDRTLYAAGAVGVLDMSFPRAVGPVAKVKLTLDTARVRGANEIDAVGLLPAPK